MNNNKAIEIIRSKAKDRHPRVAIILGTGLSSFTEHIQNKIVFPYRDLLGFPDLGVEGHVGELIFGQINDIEIVVLKGRAHYYESGKPDAMKSAIETLKDLGCETLLLTNAAGSLISEMLPGSLMLLTDHINFTGVSPLFGETGISRFVNMADAYNPSLCDKFRVVAKSKNINLHEGVYIWFSGPSFETCAEIQAAKSLGASAVGMSTVPEVILGRFYGLNVSAVSIITNMASGMSDEHLNHAHSLENAEKGASNLQALLSEFLLYYDE